jgi:hypothetical protein
MPASVRLPAPRCLICCQPLPPGRTLLCSPNCAQAWRIFEHFRAHEPAAPPPESISLALARLARGEPAIVR